MANYSEIKYSTVTAAGFAKEDAVTELVVSTTTALETRIRSQLERLVDGGFADTLQFLSSIGNGIATTTLFNAEYDGGSANG